MGQLGTYLLLFGLAVSGFGVIAAAVGAKTGRPGLVESARRSAFALIAVMLAANATMMTALLSNDFAIRYVAENSARETPTFFKALSLWAADDGSLLLWNLILAGFIAAVALRFRRDRPGTFSYALAVLFSVQVFYLILVNGPARPFGGLASPPADGRGPAPLLQNYPLMAVHPPFLYLGFIGFTVPFAFGIAALLAGENSGQWISIIRRWTLVVWCFLTVGLVLGALWSYSVLGWGGYWAWDPVENVALLPWLTSTAFLHSVMLQERRGMAKLWNIALVIGAFALMTFGTFLTRGNVLSSVHAFAQTSVGPAYLIFLAVVLLAGFGLVVWRLPSLRTAPSLTSAISREGAFVANNVLLLAATVIILLGTAFPLLVQAVSGQQITIGGPYFTSSIGPVFLLILLLAGTAPLLPWRATNRSRALRRLRVPALAAAAVMVVTAVAGVHKPVAIAGFGLAALVFVTSGQEILATLAIGRRAHPAGVLRALIRGRRRCAAMVVHLGLALVAAGIMASSTLGQQAQVTLKTGQSTVFGGQILRYEGLRTVRQPQRTVLTTTLSVTSPSGAQAGTLDPSINLYPASTEPIGSPSIHRGLIWDVYASLITLQDDGATATFRLYRNPGVNWLWFGGLVMALGGVGAAWPTRRRRKAGDKRPAGRQVRACFRRSWRPVKRRVRLLAVVVVAVAGIVTLLATGLGRDPSVIASPLVGHRAPNFTLPQFDGPPLTLSKLRGQIVVLNFWASWCTECKTEQAALDRTWQHFQNSGVVVVGVDFEDATGDARNYAQSAGVTYPIVEDANSAHRTHLWLARSAGDLRGEPVGPYCQPPDRAGRLGPADQRDQLAAGCEPAVTAAGSRLRVRAGAPGFVVLLALVAGLAALIFVAVRGNPVPSRAQEVQQLAASLHCPICKDLSVADSPAPLAQEMRQEIAQKLSAGESPDQIRAGFVAAYGDSVLMTPPRQGLPGVAYYLPWLVLLAGVVAAVTLLRRWLHAARAAPAGAGSPRLSESQQRALARAVAQLRAEEPG